MSKRRLFIAIDLPEDVKEEIIILEKEIDKKFGQRLNWINKMNLHLTLLFLGYIDNQHTERIKKLLEGVVKPKPFQLKINEVDYGPDEKIKRMIWFTFEPSEELLNLQGSVKRSLEESNVPFQKENRLYYPHINLIRFKESLVRPPIRRVLNLEFRVEQFALKESILKRGGAEYNNMAVFQLI